MKGKKIAVVIPARNEEEHIAEVVRGARKHADQVIVVDDGSVDRTAEEASCAGARVLKLSKNKGKGYAMRVGAERALSGGAGVIVFMDGDGQHRPEDIPVFLKGLEDADAVFGNREGGDMPLIKRFGNRGIGLLFRILFKHYPKDMLCGFKAFRADALKKVWWQSDGYFVETEITAKSFVKGLRIRRVDIPIIYKDVAKGTSVLDGLIIGLKMILLKLNMLAQDLFKSPR